MTVGELIQKKRNELGLTQEELAKTLGYESKSSINKIELGKADIPRPKVVEFAKILGLKPADLFPELDKDVSTIISIPFISQKLSAGFGEDYLSDISVKSIDVLPSAIKGYSRSKVVAAEVKGDSMIEANIYPEDVVLFARGVIEGDGIYVLSMEGELFVKRLQFDPFEKKLSIISANKNYSTKVVSADMDGLRILGKVIGWFHYER